jgi:hypothetical protein
MKKLVEHYKAILNELMSMEDLVKQRGAAGALDQAKRDRDRLDRFAKSRPDNYGDMSTTTRDRFTNLVRTRLPSVSVEPTLNDKNTFGHNMQITTDRAGREMPINFSLANAVYGKSVYDNKIPKQSTLNTAGIWLPGKDGTADAARDGAHSNLDRLRKLENKQKRERFGQITRPPAPPDA